MSDQNTARATLTGAPACSLSPGALDGRVRQWQSLVAQELSRESGQGWARATYPNVPDVSQRLAELIAAEKECCGFLEFDVQERGSELDVELRYPPEIAPMLAAIWS